MKSTISYNAEAEKIDWSKVQLVETDYIVVLTSGIHKGNTFSGTCVLSKEKKPHEYCQKWYKHHFRLLPPSQSITLKND